MLNPTILDVDELAAKTIVPQHIDIDLKQQLQSTPTSPNSPILLDEVTKLDSSVLSRELHGKHKPRKEAHISPDESRLLGAPRQPHDPYAVKITPRASNPGKEGMGLEDMPRGFHPTNTLTRSANFQLISRNRHMGEDRSNERKRNVLETETSTGDNVPSVQQHSKFSIECIDRSRAKRPKLGSRSSAENSDVIEETFDPRRSEGYTVIRPQQSQGRNQRKGSQGPSSYGQTQGIGQCFVNAEVKEFGSVERTMKNGEKPISKRRQHKSGNHLPSNTSSTAIGMPTSSLSLDPDPIQSTLQHKQEIVNNSSRPPYKGTARIPSPGTNHARSITRFREHQENGGQSRHFEHSSQSQLLLNDHDPEDSSNSKGQGRLNKPLRLKELFVDSHGKRRGVLRSSARSNSISSDELASATIVGDNARRPSPARHSRANSPLKPSSSQKAVSTSSNTSGLAPSNTPASIFTTSRSARSSKRVPAQQTTLPGETEATWSIDLVCVNVAGEAGEPIRGPNLGLVFENITKTYVIRKDGNSLTEKNESLRIQPKKLMKVKWGTDSSKVRFESSKTGKHDHVLDIEMSSHKAVCDLLKELDLSSEVKISSGSPMDKIFENRQSENIAYSRKAGNSGTQVPQDIQLAARNKERRDAAQDKLSEPENYKRRRGRSQADEDVNKDHLSRGMKQFSREPRSRTIFDSEGELAENVPRKMGKMLRVIHPKPPNPHLRELRNKSEVEPRNSGRQSPLEEFPRHLRYSATGGLGNPWSKSLLYPKTGKKISVEWIDLERLDEGEFLNDNLIAFYLRFLQEQLEQRSPELSKRVYFFNTFFFASLTNTQRGKKGINYEAVQKWTRSVNVFSYDYVVVPINESAHWYVAIICNLPALATNPDLGEDTPKDEPPLSSSDHDEPDGLSTRSLGRNSSPAANVSVEENCLLSQEIEDPIEQVPSASFAEMSLEPDFKRRSEVGKAVHTIHNAADNPTSDGVGQVMRDMQIKENMAELATLEQKDALSAAVVLDETKDDENIVQSHAAKASPVSRKRKRKSIPPTQRTDPTSPLILTFDSLGLAHPVTVRILKDYLFAEGRAKRAIELDVSRIKGMTAKQIPQQDNMCDCGLFLLGYIDKFLDDPKDFISKVIGHKYDLEKDWSKLIPSDLRANIRSQIQALYAEQESERRDERRESAKRANKYHERPPQHSDADSSSNTTQLKTTPSEASEALKQELIAVAGNLSPERPSTRELELKIAIPMSETPAQQDNDVFVKQSKRSRSNQNYQDSSDPLHQDVENIVRRSPSPLLQEESSLIVMESQSDPAVRKGTTHSEPFSAIKPRSRSISVGLPSTIEDSQPSPFQDLLAAEKDYSKASPPPSSVQTEDQRSAGRGVRTNLSGPEFDEHLKDDPRTKPTAPESVDLEHQPRGNRRYKQVSVCEIVELDD